FRSDPANTPLQQLGAAKQTSRQRMLMKPVRVFHAAPIRTKSDVRVGSACLDRPLAYDSFIQQAFLNPVPNYRIGPRDPAETHLYQIEHEFRFRQPNIFKPDTCDQTPRTEPEVVAREEPTVAHWAVFRAVIYCGEQPGFEFATMKKLRLSGV